MIEADVKESKIGVENEVPEDQLSGDVIREVKKGTKKILYYDCLALTPLVTKTQLSHLLGYQDEPVPAMRQILLGIKQRHARQIHRTQRYHIRPDCGKRGS